MFDFLKKKELQEIEVLKEKLKRYSAISDIEAETDQLRQRLYEHAKSHEATKQAAEEKLKKLEADYQAALSTYTRLRTEVSLYENKLDLIEFGIYEPVYDFEKSDDYRTEQKKVSDLQKTMITDDRAAICDTVWTVQGSEAKGKAMVKVYKKLMLRAFNGECDVLIAKVRWNNINQMLERMGKLFETVNKLGVGINVNIAQSYLELKRKELRLEYEYQQKKQHEKEELRARQEELREEEKARREYEMAQRDAEKEEANYQKALDKAKKELGLVSGEEHDRLSERIKLLEQELQEAHEKKERALSMAQQTKRGHVYVISNIGSFGEEVHKIGMTRRLEPIDRVKELGDASVPFQFDIHAMIFSEDAPSLENELHKAFADKRINMLNNKKEFFKVTIDEIEQRVKALGLGAEFIKLPEAMEFRETQAIIEKLRNPEPQKTIQEIVESEFPSRLV